MAAGMATDFAQTVLRDGLFYRSMRRELVIPRFWLTIGLANAARFTCFLMALWRSGIVVAITGAQDRSCWLIRGLDLSNVKTCPSTV